MQPIRRFWDAAAALDPEAGALDEAGRFPICRPERLFALFIDQGFAEAQFREFNYPDPSSRISTLIGRPSSAAKGPPPPTPALSPNRGAKRCGSG